MIGRAASDDAPGYVELQVTTHFSFLRGASSPEELFAAAAMLGLPALGVVDRNSLAGIVRAWDAQKATGVRSIVGCRLDLTDGTALLVYPTDRPAYANLCRLLSVGKARAGKGACHLGWSDVEEWNAGLIGMLVPDRADAVAQAALARTARIFGDRAYMALSLRRRPRDAVRLRDLAALARAAQVPTVATGDVLSNADAAAIVTMRGDQPYSSVEEVQRRANVGGGPLDRIGEADGFGSLDLSRRAGLWGVKGLGNEALPLFAAADAREGKLRAEAIEPEVVLAPMGEGSEVVEDYRASGLSLRAHPLAFLRDELKARKMITCEQLQSVKDGRWIELAGIVLVRQKPGSAKGVMFITLEDETNVANLVVWTNIFEKNRRTVLGASMMGVRGQVQREGAVIHVIAQRLDDLSPLLASVGSRTDVSDIYRVSRADVVKSPVTPDPRDPAEKPLGRGARDLYVPDLRLGSGIIPGQPTEGIKIKPRDFR